MYKIAKRLMDLIIATIALIVLLPVFVLVIIILLFTGEHEILFLQKRIGYKNKSFYIWKFATMDKNSPNIGTGEITLRNDPRVTRFGRFLRRTKINELPQLINVLKGDMSVVGPRPLMEISFNQYAPEVKKVIYNCKPGMTGIGSIIFRDEEKLLSEAKDPKAMYASIYPYKAELEGWYRMNASVYIDCMIIFFTAWSIFFPCNRLISSAFKNIPQRSF